MPFYGLYIPSKGANGANGSATASLSASASTSELGAAADTSYDKTLTPYVFRIKGEALDVLKQNKEARLREFIHEEDAIKYAQTGYEAPQINKFSDVKNSTAMEKAAFRGPTKQEFIEFRKVIESGDYERVKTMIWDNPRYLVSSGDTPTTLKEGYRYNAMHVCAISKKPRIAELILQTVSNPTFVDLLTGKKNDSKMCKELCLNLLDYYLNIPEKGRSETPLHLASKIGAVEVIEVLVSYPECRMTVNSEGLMPKDIICTRAANFSPETITKIRKLLEERFYVPVLRSMDTAIPPQIGQPFSANNPPNLNCDPLSPEVKIQALAGPMNKEQAHKFCRRWKTPPRLGSNASSPIANNPFISPMKARGSGDTPTKTPRMDKSNMDSPKGASLQRRCLFNSTPTRSPMSSANGTGEQPEQNGHEFADSLNMEQQQNGKPELFEQDEQKENNPTLDIKIEHDLCDGVEANNNNYNNNAQSISKAPAAMNMLKTALCPKTPLMQMKKEMFFKYRDQHVASPVVFDAPNSLANNSFSIFDLNSPGYRERNLKITDTEKGLECLGRELAKEHNVDWREYWDFLNAFIDITSTEGLAQLETYFAKRNKEQELAGKNMQSAVDDVCKALEKYAIDLHNRMANDNNEHDQYATTSRSKMASSSTVDAASTPTTPYTCVEKSLQVFAKRMTKTIIHNLENENGINDTLLSELKRLKSLICSFKDDERFHNVSFGKVHSRIGNLISIYLENNQDVSNQQKLKIQNIIRNRIKSPGERREHLECVCNRILNMMENPLEQVLPENLKTEDMCSKIWLKERDCECQWEINLSRRTSNRHRRQARDKASAKAMVETTNAAAKVESNNGTVNGDDKKNCYRNVPPAYDSSDDDIFWTDEGSDSEDDEVWLTPPESPSRISMIDNEEPDRNKVFVYGKEPTKRDLDVLNAIFHLTLDEQIYPHIHSWKSNLMRFSSAQMDCFPSPMVVKSGSRLGTPGAEKKDFLSISSTKLRMVSSSPLPVSPLVGQANPSAINAPLPSGKRLFSSPAAAANNKSKMGLSFGLGVINKAGPPQTPLNKLRGLFSVYRERLDSSPVSMSSGSPGMGEAQSSSDSSSSNIGLMHISSECE